MAEKAKAAIDIVTGLVDLADKITDLVQKQIAYGAKLANDANNDYNRKTHFLDRQPGRQLGEHDGFQEPPLASLPISNAATVTYKIWIFTSGKYIKRREFGVDNWQIVGNFKEVSKKPIPFREPEITYVSEHRKPLVTGPSAVSSGGVDGSVKVGGWITIPKSADPTPPPATASMGGKIVGISYVPLPVPKPAVAQPPVKPVPAPTSKPAPPQPVADPALPQPPNPALPDQPIADTYSDDLTNGVVDQQYMSLTPMNNMTNLIPIRLTTSLI